MKSNIYRKKTVERIDKKFALLGVKNRTVLFLNIRLITTLLMFVLFVLLSNIGIILGPIISILFYCLFEYMFLDLRIKKRKKRIEEDAVLYFGLVLVALKTNNNLIKSLTLASKKEENLLAKEFKIVLKDVEYGKSMYDALSNIKKSIPSDSVNNIILSIAESNDNVSNLILLLERQLNILQEKKLLDKKRIIYMIPIKIKIVTLLFIGLISLLIYYTLYNLDFFH